MTESNPPAESTRSERTPTFSRIDAMGSFGPEQYAAVFKLLQAHPGPKLLDLSQVVVTRLDFLEQLIANWHVPPGTVRQLGIVMTFEQWAVFRFLAAPLSMKFAALDVAVTLLYKEQADDDALEKWFFDGEISHNAIGVLEWLTSSWQPTTLWHTVLSAASELLMQHVDTGEATAKLFTDAAGLALWCGGSEQAADFAREALKRFEVGTSATRCKALGILGAALIGKGEATVGLLLLEQAVTMAAAVDAPEEAARALRTAGLHALDREDFARAEAKFRAAIALLPSGPPDLLALLHHNLAVALFSQGQG